MRWRVIPSQTFDPHTNVALEQAITELVAEGKSPPTIRFYRWRPGAVIFGYFQEIQSVVNIPKCKSFGIPYIRRWTGGGAMYLDQDREFTYSIIGPEELFPKDITASYQQICGWVIQGLQDLGLPASFQPINDIVVHGKKISGNAQTRRGGALLHHGTILCDVDVDTMFSVLKVNKQKISDKNITDIKKRVTCIKDYSDISQTDLESSLTKALTISKDFYFGNYSDAELSSAQNLIKTKYGTREWNFWR